MVGRLVVTGLGIRLGSQLTWEARRAIERADRLFYLVANPAAESWVRRLNASAESLADCYVNGEPRDRAYRAMVERILAPVRQGFQVCAAFYGHPGVFVYPSHEAIRIARSEGFEALMLPGISAEDCLFADLGVDPGWSGCQSYEATDFLVHERRIDPRTALILWQVGLVGRVESRRGGYGRNRRGLTLLQKALLSYYPAEHPTIVYEASPYAVVGPSVQHLPLGRLREADLDVPSTLFVPPIPSVASEAMLKRLGIDSLLRLEDPPAMGIVAGGRSRSREGATRTVARRAPSDSPRTARARSRRHPPQRRRVAGN